MNVLNDRVPTSDIEYLPAQLPVVFNKYVDEI